MTTQLILIEEVAILLLLIATLVAIVFRRLRVPYTVGLVLVGTALAFLGGGQDFSLTPELILGILVPPLLFEAAFNLRFRDLQRNLRTVLFLAIPGVIITTLLVGSVVALGTDLDFSLAIVFGALIAATDPVAVVALFRSLGVPHRLQVIIEGESLFNDGTAVVVFGLALSTAISGEFVLLESIVDFLRVAGGGVLLGLLLGSIVSFVLSRVNDPLIETALTFVLAYGSFLLAEDYHLSGVLAVVVAGLISGNIGPRAMSPTTRNAVFNFWQFAAFLANSFVFLLIGLEVEIPRLLENAPSILVAIVAVLLARAVVIYGIGYYTLDLPMRWRHVTLWGGLRGAISLALVLSLPLTMATGRSQLQAMAFGVVLFTLLVQGLTMEPLLRKLNINPRHEKREELDYYQARSASLRTAYDHLDDIHNEGIITDATWRRTSETLRAFMEHSSQKVQDLLGTEPGLKRSDEQLALREILRAQRSALTQLHNEGTISREAYAELLGRIDATMNEDEIDWELIQEYQSDLKEDE